MATAAAKKKESVELSLQLSFEEASMLKAMMQNSTLGFENETEEKVRITIFNALATVV